VDPERAIRMATEKFISRFEQMEKLIEEDGKEIEALSPQILDGYWNKVKELKESSKESEQ